MGFAAIAGITAAGFIALASVSSSLPGGQIFHAGLSQEQFAFIVLTISGPSAAIGVLLLSASLLPLIPSRWMRVVAGVLISLTTLAAAAWWTIYFVFSFLGVFAFNSVKVTADDGQSVIVKQQGVGPSFGYRIYRQLSPFTYGSSVSGGSGDEEFPTQHCTLASQGPALTLTCGKYTILVPPTPK
ncbi:hypothetical protein [Arthrobacter sp. GMC3]|uniref:hypothetical protein n=1 Tax=Arthrobacter sp. GMC3 TaxID=2058894 RepID=UPI000CE2F88B|nr:hypothetical protein [Arthrobacter sp. GMC3]